MTKPISRQNRKIVNIEKDTRKKRKKKWNYCMEKGIEQQRKKKEKKTQEEGWLF